MPLHSSKSPAPAPIEEQWNSVLRCASSAALLGDCEVQHKNKRTSQILFTSEQEVKRETPKSTIEYGTKSIHTRSNVTMYRSTRCKQYIQSNGISPVTSYSGVKSILMAQHSSDPGFQQLLPFRTAPWSQIIALTLYGRRSSSSTCLLYTSPSPRD